MTRKVNPVIFCSFDCKLCAVFASNKAQRLTGAELCSQLLGIRLWTGKKNAIGKLYQAPSSSRIPTRVAGCLFLTGTDLEIICS